MKNLVEGQEISIFKDSFSNNALKFIKKLPSGWLYFIINFIFSNSLFYFILFFIIPKSTDFYEIVITFIEGFNVLWFIFFGIILAIISSIFISIIGMSTAYLFGYFWVDNLPNPLVIYFDECLFVSTPSYSSNNQSREEQIMFKGEIPFRVIERILFQKEFGRVTIILNKNSEFYKSEKFFSEDYINSSRFHQKRIRSYVSEDFTFQLPPELRGIGLQIVEELNSKVGK